MALTRAQFLRGDWQGRTRTAALAHDQRLTITPACLTWQGVLCRSCAEACDAEAIEFRPIAGSAPRPSVDARACTACGDCLPACPASAIRLDIDRSAGPPA